jgi:hypothetical protein
MKNGMAKAGYAQGDMAPKVDDYQRPSSNYSQEGFNKTTEYIERQDKFVAAECSQIKKQAYKGRYS